jgi:ribosome biogenesis GTPase
MTEIGLTALGWDARLAEAFSDYRERGLVPGRVSLEHNHVYRVLIGHGADDLLAEAAGRMKHRAGGRHELPVVGDWVAIRPGPPGTRAAIDAILPRRTQFSRKAAGRETEQQVIAANIDIVFLVFGLDGPVKARRIERYLIPARQSGATPVVVLNKMDACRDVPDAIAEAEAAAGGAAVHAVSAHAVDSLAPIQALTTHGNTLALLGPSGVGKSSIANALAGRQVLKTGEVRPWDSRGRHTSVHRQLIVLDSGASIIDTPGLRELQLWEPEAAVDETFTDIGALADGCRFRDCRHDREPGCAVKAAVESGDLSADRYEHYLQLQKEQQALEQRRLQKDRGR